MILKNRNGQCDRPVQYRTRYRTAALLKTSELAYYLRACVKIIRPQNGPRRVASRLNLAGLFKARKDVCKIFLVALATPELLLFSRR